MKKHGNVIPIDRRERSYHGVGQRYGSGFNGGFGDRGQIRLRPPGPGRRGRFFGLLLLCLPLIGALALWRYSAYQARPKTVITVGPFEPVQTELPDVSLSGYSHIMAEAGKTADLKKIVTGLGFNDDVAEEMQTALGRLKPESAPPSAGAEKPEDKAEPAPDKTEPIVQPLIRPGQILRFALGKSKNPSLVLLHEPDQLGRPTEISLRANKNGKYRATVVEVPNVRRERVAVGVIRTSFSAAATREGVPQDVLDEFVDLFSDRVVFHKDFRAGDRFTVIYREGINRRGSRGKETGSILAAALEVNDKQLVAASYVGTDGKRRFFDQSGQLLGNAFLRYPLTFSRITSYFSRSRFHPVLKFSRPHNGVDFAAPIGTPVRSVAEGTVEFAGYAGGSGNMVKIAHGKRYSTAYLHLSRIDKSVKKGARTSRGQIIGAVGMTGLATGPHLHYAFYDNGNYIDPLKMALPTLDSLGTGLRVDRNYLKRVLFTLDHYQKVKLNDFYRD